MATLTSSTALAAFHKLLAAWSIVPGPTWRMLTGLDYQAESLTDDQVDGVAYLIAINAAMKRISGQPIGAWMAGWINLCRAWLVGWEDRRSRL